MANEEHIAILAQGVEAWNRWRSQNPEVKPNLTDIELNRFDIRGADLRGADLRMARIPSAIFSGEDLSNVNLSAAYLRMGNFENANFTGANFTGANLELAKFSGANLSHCGFWAANLEKASLYGANLYGANLRTARLVQANLTNAELTGACITDWHINDTTKLNNVTCEYIFRTRNARTGQYTGRLPTDPESFFAPGEFVQRFQILASALETIDITFTDGIDWQAFFRSFQELRRQYPSRSIAVQGLEQKGDAFIVRLEVEATDVPAADMEVLKGEIETTQKQLYSAQLALSAAQGEIKVYREMMGVVKTLAGKPMGEQHFHGPVGNVANTNYGNMTAYINQNQESISQLITALRSSAQAFPSEQKEEVLMELEDLETDLSQPDKQNPKRLGKRLQRLIAAGTAAATLASGAVTFSGNVNEFTDNVLELGEKIGLAEVDIQPESAQSP